MLPCFHASMLPCSISLGMFDVQGAEGCTETAGGNMPRAKKKRRVQCLSRETWEAEERCGVYGDNVEDVFNTLVSVSTVVPARAASLARTSSATAGGGCSEKLRRDVVYMRQRRRLLQHLSVRF